MNQSRYPFVHRGQLEWTRLAEAHKPSDPMAVAREVRRLHAESLSAVDISEALGIALPAVLEMIQRGQP